MKIKVLRGFVSDNQGNLVGAGMVCAVDDAVGAVLVDHGDAQNADTVRAKTTAAVAAPAAKPRKRSAGATAKG